MGLRRKHEETGFQTRQMYEEFPFTLWNEGSLDHCRKLLTDHWRWTTFRSLRVLDVGCGTGCWSIAFRQLGAVVHAFDVTPVHVSVARKEAAQRGLDIRFAVADLFSFETDERYDLVWSNGVLHHTYDALAGLRHIAKFVAPGGWLAVSLYNRRQYAVRAMRWATARFGGGAVRERLRFVKRRLWAFRLALWPFSAWWRDGDEATDRWLVDFFCHVRYSYYTYREVAEVMHCEQIIPYGPFWDYSSKPGWKRAVLRWHPYFNELFSVVGRRRA